MGFKFSLQALLKRNGALRDEAKRLFSEAQNHLNETLLSIEAMDTQKHQTHIEMAKIRKTGGSVFGGLEVRHEYLQGLDIKIERQQEVARSQMELVEQKRLEMVEAIREYRKIEILRDKRLKQFREQEKKKKAKQLDDIILIRGGYTRGTQ